MFKNFMTRRFRELLVAAILAGMVAVAAQASTLRLKDGSVVHGTYLGGTKDQVQFLVNGEVKIFNTADVASITFVSDPQAQDLASASGLVQTVTVPEGTPILIRMIDGIDSSVNRPGDIFHASLEDALTVGDVVVAPKDADAYGKLVEVKSAGRLAGKSELRLELTGVRTLDGSIQPVVTGDYEAAGKSRTKQTVKHSVIGAVAGTVIGAVAGGGEGAAIGAAAGAGAGAGVSLITHGPQVKVPSETLLKFRLAQPFTFTAAKQSE